MTTPLDHQPIPSIVSKRRRAKSHNQSIPVIYKILFKIHRYLFQMVLLTTYHPGDWCCLVLSPCLSTKPSFEPVSMMISSNGNIFALLALCAGNSPVTGEFPSQRPVTRGIGVSFDLGLNKRLSKQSRRCRWFKTPSRLLWRYCMDPV